MMKIVAAAPAFIQEPEAQEFAQPQMGKVEVLRELTKALIAEVEALADNQSLDLSQGINLYEELRRYEMKLIQRALKLTMGNQKRAAVLLGVNPSSLSAKIQRLNLMFQGIADQRQPRNSSEVGRRE